METGEGEGRALVSLLSACETDKSLRDLACALEASKSSLNRIFPTQVAEGLQQLAEDPEYRIVFKFRDRETLAAWESSAERAELLGEIEALLQEPSEREVLSGIVTWFTMPGQNPVQPPPRYKMTLVSWLALYPAVTLVFLLFGDLLARLPLPLRTLLVTAVVMLLMSYVLMPRMTRWFAFWLFPRDRSEER